MIHYRIGDATEPIKRPAVLPHCCNDAAGWGRGYVVALSAKYPEPEQAYRKWFRDGEYEGLGKPELGKCQIVQVKPDIWVANIIGQHGIQWMGKVPPVRYPAIEQGLKIADQFAIKNGASLHSPRIGCVLAGGVWIEIETIILRSVTVDAYVYTLPNQVWKWKDAYENPDEGWKGNPIVPMDGK